MNEVAVKHINTSVPVPSKMMASKKKASYLAKYHRASQCIYILLSFYTIKKNPKNQASSCNS